MRCWGNISWNGKNRCVGVCVRAVICRCDLMRSLIFSRMTANLHPAHPPAPPTRTNLPAIYSLSVKQKDSKNKRLNFLPQTTIRPVFWFADRASDCWAEEEMETSHLTQSSAALSPIIFQHAETSEGGESLTMRMPVCICAVQLTQQRATSNGWHVAVPLCALAGHPACRRVGGLGRVMGDGSGGCQAVLTGRRWTDSCEWSHQSYRELNV